MHPGHFSPLGNDSPSRPAMSAQHAEDEAATKEKRMTELQGRTSERAEAAASKRVRSSSSSQSSSFRIEDLLAHQTKPSVPHDSTSVADEKPDAEKNGVDSEGLVKSPTQRTIGRRRCRNELRRDYCCSYPGCDRRYEAWRSLQHHMKTCHGVREKRADYEFKMMSLAQLPYTSAMPNGLGMPRQYHTESRSIPISGSASRQYHGMPMSAMPDEPMDAAYEQRTAWTRYEQFSAPSSYDAPQWEELAWNGDRSRRSFADMHSSHRRPMHGNSLPRQLMRPEYYADEPSHWNRNQFMRPTDYARFTTAGRPPPSNSDDDIEYSRFYSN